MVWNDGKEEGWGCRWLALLAEWSAPSQKRAGGRTGCTCQQKFRRSCGVGAVDSRDLRHHESPFHWSSRPAATWNASNSRNAGIGKAEGRNSRALVPQTLKPARALFRKIRPVRAGGLCDGFQAQPLRTQYQQFFSDDIYARAQDP